MMPETKHSKLSIMAFQFSYDINPAYAMRAAYYSMVFAIAQPLKIYSGGLGFLAGSHMRSAYDLKQAVVGVGMLWKYGYYDQSRHEDGSLNPVWTEKTNNFLVDSGVTVRFKAFGKDVFAKAWLLPSEVFGSAPMVLMSTDVPENDAMTRAVTNKLYDDNKIVRTLQYMTLGIGGSMALEALGYAPEVYHMNEAHALPMAFYLLDKHNSDLEAVRSRLIFTTHTPEDAGNERSDFNLIAESGFLCGVSHNYARSLGIDQHGMFNYTLAGLRMARKANGVSKIHGKLSNEMWNGFAGVPEITSITNAQNKLYWADKPLEAARIADDATALVERKRQLKANLFEVVADQTGKVFEPDVLTMVWARRFAGYKRANILFRRMERLNKLATRKDMPLQMIWAGKPYPLDREAIGVFNELHYTSKPMTRCATLVGYELGLSKLLKQGSDLWLNTPRFSREASGTSGMTAAMNGSINFSIADGWVAEFGEHKKNSFVIPHLDPATATNTIDDHDIDHLYDILEYEIVPMYYNRPGDWWKMVMQNMADVSPIFDADRMADEYYEVMYKG